MAPVGPQLPTSKPEKRKRDEDETDDSDSSSDSATGPIPPTKSPETVTKKARVIGPSLPPPLQGSGPPAPLQEDDNSSDDDDDDDDFGPTLPPSTTLPSQTASSISKPAPQPPRPPTPPSKRDDWMLIPPSGGDWTARVDPTKLKSRKFASGKGAKGPSSSLSNGGDATDSWHETPQEKQARLQREVMGIKEPSGSRGKSAATQPSSDKIDKETARRLQEYNKSRGPSLYEARQEKEGVEKDDDPSARAFDREKDIGGGLQVNATQRRDMMKKATDFSSRFSSAKYL